MAAATDNLDHGHMRAALGLARRTLGTTAPNPAVGCVLVRPDLGGAGRVVGRGWTQPGGRPHAETEAISRAGELAQGATAYVTLEPCAHDGRTPPCAQALIEAGISRVVVACPDPDPRVDGGGISMLKSAGIDVLQGVEQTEAENLNAGFFSKIRSGRPLVTVKTATSLDGAIATHSGKSQWITGAEARARGHALRACHDAIMVGSGTARIDNPRLTCRLPGMAGYSPRRIVVDGHLSLPLTSHIIATAGEIPTLIVTLADGDAERRKAFAGTEADIIEVRADENGRPDLTEALTALGTRGITRLLVEAGGRLTAGLLRANLVDRLIWFRAPVLIGGDGQSAAGMLGVEELDKAPRFRRLEVSAVGDDIMETYVASERRD